MPAGTSRMHIQIRVRSLSGFRIAIGSSTGSGTECDGGAKVKTFSCALLLATLISPGCGTMATCRQVCSPNCGFQSTLVTVSLPAGTLTETVLSVVQFPESPMPGGVFT